MGGKMNWDELGSKKLTPQKWRSKKFWAKSSSRKIEEQAWRNIHAEVTDYINQELNALDVVEATTDLPMVAAVVGLKHKIEEDLMQLQRDQAQEEEEWYATQTVSNQEVIQDWELWKDPIQAEFESLATKWSNNYRNFWFQLLKLITLRQNFARNVWWRFGRSFSFLNGWFVGSMLIFQGVYLIIYMYIGYLLTHLLTNHSHSLEV